MIIISGALCEHPRGITHTPAHGLFTKSQEAGCIIILMNELTREVLVTSSHLAQDKDD